MDQINQQVKQARRRLVMEQLFAILPWSLFAALLVAVIGLAIPKIWYLEVDPRIWQWSWLGGALAVGLLVGGIWTYCVRRQPMDAAIEIDRRYGLRERVASALMLDSDSSATEVGSALIADTSRRLERIDVSEHFAVRPTWRTLLPLVPAAFAFVLVLFVSNKQRGEVDAATTTATATQEQLKKTRDELKKKIIKTAKKAEQMGLKDAESLLKEVEKGIEKIDKSEADRKNTLVKLNDLASDIKKRRDKLGGAEDMKKQLNQLKDIQQGPADKVAKAIREGDFNKAMENLKDLQKKLENNELNDQEKEELAKQMENLQEKLQEMAENHENAKNDLREQIEQARQAGDLDRAGKLQNQLDKLNRMDPQMNQLQDLAQKMGQAKEAMQNGDLKEAAAQMQQMADGLQEMQNELDELETLDDVMDQIADAKDAMNCKQCQGQGCEACQGGGFGQGQGDNPDGDPGQGLGAGRGIGARPEAEEDTSHYETQVRMKVRQGEAIRTGDAGGQNIAGRSREEAKSLIQSEISRDADPLTNQKLPKTQQKQAREYFERFRKGE